MGRMVLEMRVEGERQGEAGDGDWMKVSRGNEEDAASPERRNEKRVQGGRPGG